jgi:error-prone DNA polymerase
VAARGVDLPREQCFDENIIRTSRRCGDPFYPLCVIFATIEDETSIANLIVWPKTFERYRRTVLAAQLLLAEGTLQREGLVIHVIADRLTDLSPELHLLSESSAAGLQSRARANKVNHPGRDVFGVSNPDTIRHAPAAMPKSRDLR